jgi:F-type H+-transporting ATPase subunit c
MKKLLLGMSSALLVSLYSLAAFAQDAAAAGGPAASNANDKSMAAMLAAAIAIGVAAFGGALGQARIGAAALEGIARNPGASGKITTPMILGLALVESLVLYAFVIAFLVYGKA